MDKWTALIPLGFLIFIGLMMWIEAADDMEDDG